MISKNTVVEITKIIEFSRIFITSTPSNFCNFHFVSGIVYHRFIIRITKLMTPNGHHLAIINNTKKYIFDVDLWRYVPVTNPHHFYNLDVNLNTFVIRMTN